MFYTLVFVCFIGLPCRDEVGKIPYHVERECLVRSNIKAYIYDKYGGVSSSFSKGCVKIEKEEA